MGHPHQSASAAMAGHPVVGAWAWDISSFIRPGARSYTVFHADGTFVEAHPLLGAGLGVWRATGERTLGLFIVCHDRDAGGDLVGFIASRRPVAVVGAGNALTFACAYEVTALDGAIEKAGSLTETATRITVEGLHAGTPNAGTPTP